MRRFTIPNILSAARLALVPPTVLVLLSERFAAAALLIGACGLLDALDGALARKLRQESALGKALDPLADKALCGAVFIALAAIGRIPAWFAFCVVARDAGILLASALLFLFRARDRIPSSKPSGKIAFALLLAAAIVSILWPALTPPFLVAACAAMSWSVVSYGRAAFNHSASHEPTPLSGRVFSM